MNEENVNNISDLFVLEEYEGENKVTTLERAVRDHVRPGMNLYITPEGGSAICELIRQFRGTKPKFTLTIAGSTEHALNLVHCGMARKLITTNCSHLHPNPGVIKLIQQAYERKEIEIESWSLYSHQQRLMAGALGVGFMPTKSILDSSMAEENTDSFLQINNPFDNSEKVGLVKGLNPDLALVHAWAADRFGNTIGISISPQTSTDHNMWGAKASKEGVIVTVERIVSTEFIRKYSSLVGIPGSLVKAVCHVPYGAHPAGMFSPIPGLFESYAPDYDFIVKHRKASGDSHALDSWLAEWVFGCKSHEDYVSRLGQKRTALLGEKAKPDFAEKEYGYLLSGKAGDQIANETEIMILVAARQIMERVLKGQHKILLGGIGVSMLSSWMAFYLLRKAGYHLDMVVGSGTYGFEPRPGDPFYGTFNNLHTCKALFDTATIYGYFIAGKNSRSLSVLGAGEMDKYGNINSTKTESGYLIGSGGANDAANASDVFIVAKQSRHRFVDKVSYITCPGRNVRTVISNMGVFEKPEDAQELMLVGCLPDLKREEMDNKIRRIKEECGWNLKVADDIKEYAMPTGEDLSLLRAFDPESVVLGGSR